MQKAVFVDYKESDIPQAYLKRVTKLFKTSKFMARDDKNLLGELKDTEAIFAKISTKIDKEIINSAPKLKYVGVLSTAFDAIDAKLARTKGVSVCNLGGYSTEAVAEFAVATLMERSRLLEESKDQARKEDYSFDKFMCKEVKGRVLGVVGAGKIGSRVAEMALGLGMKVLYFSRKNKPVIEKLGAKKASLDKILSESEFISLNLILNKETEGIINASKIKLLKKGCIFISLAPPKLIDQQAMMKSAASGNLTFIFDHSDDIDASLAKKFLQTKNCVVYPPIAFRTEEANTARLETFASNIEGFIKGRPQNVVN
jgi:glycerate dehydrogenase